MIPQILELALRIRQQDGNKGNMVPCFSAPAGVGKSYGVKKFAKEHGYKVCDLRGALLEAPEVNGFPDPDTETGVMRYLKPEWFEALSTNDGKWVLFFDEVNRSNNSVMNAFMQALTDRQIGANAKTGKLPDNVIMTACINPDSASYSVNSMDAALYDRFEHFEIEFDLKDFVTHMEEEQYHPYCLNFVKSGQWVFRTPEQCSAVAGSKYVSPRTIKKMSDAEYAGLEKNPDIHAETSISIWGKNLGNQYHKFVFEIKPVFAKDIVENKVEAFAKISEYTKAQRGDMISLTVESVIKSYGEMPGIDDELINELKEVMSADQLSAIVEGLHTADKIARPAEYLVKNPALREFFESRLRRRDRAAAAMGVKPTGQADEEHKKTKEAKKAKKEK
jgi:hypothetical protein